MESLLFSYAEKEWREEELQEKENTPKGCEFTPTGVRFSNSKGVNVTSGISFRGRRGTNREGLP